MNFYKLATWVGGCDADLVLLQQVLSAVGDAPSVVLHAKGMLGPLWRHKARVLHQARPQCVCKILQQQILSAGLCMATVRHGLCHQNYIRDISAANCHLCTQMPQMLLGISEIAFSMLMCIDETLIRKTCRLCTW